MNIENALKIDGWMKPEELQWLATQAAFHDCIAEVGSWMGRSTRALGDNTAGIVIAVDTWAGSNEPAHKKLLASKDPDWLYEQFKDNVAGLLAREIVRPHRTASTAAANHFQEMGIKFDMIFLDAAHDYENVKADIKAWAPLLAKDGLLCGHDFGTCAGVNRAVMEAYPTAHKVGAGSIWASK